MTRQEKRPRLWWLLVLAVLAQGVLYLVNSYQYVRSMPLLDDTLQGWLEHAPSNPQSLVLLWLLVSTRAFLGLAAVVIAIGLRGRKRWAWAAAMVVEGIILVLALEAYLSRGAGVLHYGAMGLAVVTVFMLNQREIQVYYRTSHEQEELEEDGATIEDL